jgi:hypothetical protein
VVEGTVGVFLVAVGAFGLLVGWAVCEWGREQGGAARTAAEHHPGMLAAWLTLGVVAEGFCRLLERRD